jgi:hypothetical protein
VAGERDDGHGSAGWRWQHLDGSVGGGEVTMPGRLESECEPVRGGRHETESTAPIESSDAFVFVISPDSGVLTLPLEIGFQPVALLVFALASREAAVSAQGVASSRVRRLSLSVDLIGRHPADRVPAAS